MKNNKILKKPNSRGRAETMLVVIEALTNRITQATTTSLLTSRFQINMSHWGHRGSLANQNRESLDKSRMNGSDWLLLADAGAFVCLGLRGRA